MRVAVNAVYLDPGRSSGTETYLRELLPEIAAQGVDLTILTTRRGAVSLRGEGWGDVVALPADEGERIRRLGAELVGVPREAARRGCDVVHSLANTGPVAGGPPHVLTLHDVNWMHHRTLPLSTTLALKAIVPRSARRAKAIVTASEHSRDDIVRTLGLDPARIHIVPHGAGRPPETDPAPPERVRRVLGLPERGRVVLNLAVIRAHKNQALLVRALEHLPDDVTLVLAGAKEDYAREVEAIAGDRVRMPGYLDDDVLEGLWAMADAAAFPTLDEGFGLPVLEAMRRGVPVACSDIRVLREVGGDAATYFDPHDPASAARAIGAALAAEGAAGRQRAALFTWQAAARGTIAAYEAACASA